MLSARCIHLEARARAHASWVCSIRSTVPPAGLDTAHAGNRLRPQSTAGALLSLPHAVAEFAATPLQVATRSACGYVRPHALETFSCIQLAWAVAAHQLAGVLLLRGLSRLVLAEESACADES